MGKFIDLCTIGFLIEWYWSLLYTSWSISFGPIKWSCHFLALTTQGICTIEYIWIYTYTVDYIYKRWGFAGFLLIRVYIKPIIFVLNTYQMHETNIWTNMICITLYERSEQESTLIYKAATNAIKEIFFILSTFHPLHIVEDKWHCKCHWSYIITSI